MTFRLYGKTYDAVAWARAHPGGAVVIESVATLDDVVVQRLFESSHRDPAKNVKALEASEVKRLSPKSTCTSFFNNKEEEGPGRDAFAEFLRREVYGYLRKKYPSNPFGQGKAWALSKCAAHFVLWLSFLVCAFLWSSDPLKRVLFSFFAGFQCLTWGLTQFHDSSHYAFGGGFRRNRMLTASWAAIAYWPPWLWHRHHVELHHACTGDYERDPDLRHGAPFMRKTGHAPKERYFKLSVLAQVFSMALSPGMYLGQCVHYTTVRLGYRDKLWKMQNLLPPPSAAQSYWEFILSFWLPLWQAALVISSLKKGTSLFSSVFLTFLATMAYFVGGNLCYAMNILPDHDTDSSHRNLAALAKTPMKDSWAAKQVAASANWAGPKWCALFGGLNYQIEHHLFPRIHHSFYPDLAPIVKEACHKYNVPYVHYDSFLDAIKAVTQQLHDAKSDKHE